MLTVRSLGVADFEKEPKLEKCDRRKIVAVWKEGIYNSNPDAAPVCQYKYIQLAAAGFLTAPQGQGGKGSESCFRSHLYTHVESYVGPHIGGRTLGAVTQACLGPLADTLPSSSGQYELLTTDIQR